LDGKEPNGAHHALVELERRGLLAGVITQNIDGLHAAAGTRDPIEVHGSVRTASCLSCGFRLPLADVRERANGDIEGVPRCDCGAPLKPDVVLFGEYLPLQALLRAEVLAAQADLMLCIGSSLEVYPVAELPARTLAEGGQIAILTQGATPYDSRAAVRMSGDIVDELNAVLAALALTR
jgi:NAD-dependent deacetylase